MKRGSKVTLYELMHQTPGSQESKPSKQPDPAARFIRIPVGFLWCGVLILLGCLVGVYLLGYQRGVVQGEIAIALDMDDSARTDEQLLGVSEVGASPPPAAPVERTTSPTNEPSEVVEVEEAPAPAPTPEPTRPSGDPRQPGLNYYVISHPSESKAQELVDFCRANDLAAHLIRTESGSPKVIVTPGYQAGGSSSPEITRLRATIRSVGVLWKRQDPGQNGDFSTYFPEKWRPRGSGG